MQRSFTYMHNYIISYLIFNLLAILPIMGADEIKEAAKSRQPNLEMLRRIGIDKPIGVPDPSFSVAVVDTGKIYEHSGFYNIEPIEPLPSEKPNEDGHGMLVASVVRQLHPSVNIVYFDRSSTHYYDCLENALDNPQVKIINLSSSENPSFWSDQERLLNIFKKAQSLKKLLVFSAGNVQGWLGLHKKNKHLIALGKNSETRESFMIVGGSKHESNGEVIGVDFLRAGLLRNFFLIAPAVDVWAFSHIPERNGKIQVNGTSFAAPYVVAALTYVMSANPSLTPFEASRLLCETANLPRTLDHALIGDQGWGYLNLKRALDTSIPRRPLIMTPVAQGYDALLQFYGLHLTDGDKKQTLTQLVSSLQDLDEKDSDVRQLLRVAKFEYGVFLLTQKDPQAAKAALDDAKSLGLNHQDPLSSLPTNKYLIDVSEIPELKWFSSMVAFAIETRNESHESEFKDDIVAEACRNGYMPAQKIAQDKVTSFLISMAQAANNDEEFKSLIRSCRHYAGVEFSVKFKDNIIAGMSSSFLSALQRHQNISNGTFIDLINLFLQFKPDEMAIGVLIMQMVKELKKVNSGYDITLTLLPHLFSNESRLR